MGYSWQETLTIVIAELRQQRTKVENKADEALHIPIIVGPVGTGKTSLVRNVALEFALDVVSINCGENGDPTDIAGMAVPWALQNDSEGKKVSESYMQWLLNETMHIACTKPVVLFFDDIDKMPPLVEGALIGLFGKREVRNRTLHPETLLIAAGNRVADDRLAHDLSESLRTRATVIELEATIKDFVLFAEANPGVVEPSILGYLSWKPQHLHAQSENVLRFATQRGWVEASSMLKQYRPRDPFPSAKYAAWQTIISLKCGEPIGNDFWAWYTIVSAVDIEKILYQGKLETKTPLVDVSEKAMVEYAAVFALAQALNAKPVSSKYVGLEPFVQSLEPEMRVALLTQLTAQTREGLKKNLPTVGGQLLKDLFAQ